MAAALSLDLRERVIAAIEAEARRAGKRRSVLALERRAPFAGTPAFGRTARLPPNRSVETATRIGWRLMPP